MLATDLNEITDQFKQHGFVILRQVLPAEVVTKVRTDLEVMVDDFARGLLAMDLIDDLHEEQPFETRLMTLLSFVPQLAPASLRRNLHRQAMFDLFFCPQVLDLAEMFLGSELRLYPNYTVRPKFPEDAKTQVLWHQDAGYTEAGLKEESNHRLKASDLRMVNVWTSLVPARPENGCMQFIPGTHRLGVVDHTYEEHYLQIVPSELEPRLKEAIDVITDPGDVVLFSNLLFHQGQPNTSNHIRWSCDWRYQDATQPTLRDDQGHLARSIAHLDQVVENAEQWASRSFG